MKTRAILQTSPFKTRDGEWKVLVAMLSREFCGYTNATLNAEPEGLRKGDTITVEKHGSEWRAV